MFYDYLKSIYNIVEKYDPNTDNFQNMLDLNDRLINNIDKNFDSYNKISSIQAGGHKNTHNRRMRVVTFISEKNLKNDTQFGGTLHDDLKVMQASVIDMIGKLKPSDPDTANLEELKQKITKFRNTMIKLIEYIELLHQMGPGQDNLSKLSTQLTQIKEIIEKY